MSNPFRLIASLAVAGGLLAACGTLVQAPQVSLADVSIGKLSLNEQKLQVKLRVRNPNPVPLPILGFNYNVALNGLQFAKGVSNKTVVVPGGGDTLIDTEVTGSLATVLRSLSDWQRLRDHGVDYLVAGNVDAGGLGGIPFQRSGGLKLSDLPLPLPLPLPGR